MYIFTNMHIYLNNFYLYNSPFTYIVTVIIQHLILYNTVGIYNYHFIKNFLKVLEVLYDHKEHITLSII